MLREFIFGTNETGLVPTDRGRTTVVGGEDRDFPGVLTGQSAIFTGSGSTQGSYVFPAATIGAWETFIAEATALPFEPTSSGPHLAARTQL